MKKNITCIICPKGCPIVAEIIENTVNVSGYTCEKGREYALSECINPKRTVTSIVKVCNKSNCMASVKTAEPIPKDKIFEVMQKIRSIEVKAPILIGDVILEDVYGTNIIATKNIDL